MKKTIKLGEDQLRNIIYESVSSILNEQKSNLDEVHNFNSIIDKFNNTLNESNINRMLQWLKNCDCAFISAFRTELKDIKNMDATYLGPDKNDPWKVGKLFTHEENRQKNKALVAKLLQLGYGVTKVKGVYPEGMTKETSEESYLVVNRNNDENFLNNLLELGELYNQDSIYYKAKGQTKGSLIGTNGCGWPEYRQKGDDSELKTNTASNYMSRLGNKAFSFVGKDAEKVKDRKEAMDSIEKSRGTDDEWKQRHWTDNDNTSFHKRKENRKQQMKEAVNFWRNMTDGKMLIKEEIHPLTRKTMGEALRKMNKK